MVQRAQPVTSSARATRNRINVDRSTQQLVNPKLETVEQLAKRYSHLEMGFGDGKYEINKQSTKPRRTVVKQTAKKSQAPSKANNLNNNNIITSSNNNNMEYIDVDDEGDDDYMPNGTRGKRTPRQMAIPSANSRRRLENNNRRSSRPTPVKTMIASLPSNKTITTISKTTPTTTSRAKSTSNKEDKSDKPGTAGSKQALTAPKRPGSRRHNGLTSKANAPSQELIDTNNWVDVTIVQFPKELCQRAQIEDIPDNPERLCKKFVIVLSDLDVGSSETPPHASDDEQLSSWKARVSETLN